MMNAKPYKKPDLNAPRNRTQAVDFLSYPAKDIFGFFAKMKQQHPQLAKYTNKQIAGWITAFNEVMAREVATGRYGVMLPERLGAVVVGFSRLPEKSARFNIDYAASGKKGVLVAHKNDHTAGYTASIKYTNNIPRCRFKNHLLWTFKPCRKLSRAVSAEFKSGNFNRHLSVSARFPIANIYKKFKFRKPSWRKVKAEREKEMRLEQYNEFDIG